MTIFRDDEGNERIAPSTRAERARDEWLKAHPHYKEVMREQLAGPVWRYATDVDAAAERWRQAMLAKGLEQLRLAVASERMRELRRARRWMRLAITCAFFSIGTAIAVVVYYGVLGYH